MKSSKRYMEGSKRYMEGSNQYTEGRAMKPACSHVCTRALTQLATNTPTTHHSPPTAHLIAEPWRARRTTLLSTPTEALRTMFRLLKHSSSETKW